MQRGRLQLKRTTEAGTSIQSLQSQIVQLDITHEVKSRRDYFPINHHPIQFIGIYQKSQKCKNRNIANVAENRKEEKLSKYGTFASILTVQCQMPPEKGKEKKEHDSSVCPLLLLLLPSAVGNRQQFSCKMNGNEDPPEKTADIMHIPVSNPERSLRRSNGREVINIKRKKSPRLTDCVLVLC